MALMATQTLLVAHIAIEPYACSMLLPVGHTAGVNSSHMGELKAFGLLTTAACQPLLH